MRKLTVVERMTVLALGLSAGLGYGADVSITADPYLTGGLFTSPVLPQSGETVTVTIRANCAGEVPGEVGAKLVLVAPDGKTAADEKVVLRRKEGVAEGVWTWTAGANGLYTIKATVDPDNSVVEEREDNNAAQLTLPVLVKGRKLHFPWYREVATVRWATCVTSSEEKAQGRLFERGVLPLNWEYGGMSWDYYDKKAAQENPELVLKQIEETFYKKYTGGNARGFGIDECGGYPGTFAQQRSVASMKALVRAKSQMPGRFYAVWNGGGLSVELAPYYRQGADLVLLETYVWRATPDDLGTEDIYQVIRDRIDPIARGADMLVPAYGNHCYTLIALDTSERPDRTDLGEQEQVVRYIRRICPEMRGIAWYTGGYGGYGLKRTEEMDRHHQAVLAGADRLCFDYFVRPCVTLMPESLWLGVGKDGAWTLTAAVSNIGGMDAGKVGVEFRVDGRPVGVQTVDRVPAGANRNQNRVMLRQAVAVIPGNHTFEARIIEAGGATVLDPTARCERFVPGER